MTNSPQIQAIIQHFISELSVALAEEGSAAIREALAGNSGAATTTRAKPGPKPKAAAPAAAASAAKPAKAAKRAKGAKRTPEELEQLTSSLLGHIRKNPGQRVEQIGKALGVPTKELALPIIKLLDNKQLKKTGQKRATSYTAR